MSYYLQVDEQEPEQVATLSGWAAVRMWARMDVGTRTELWRLISQGWTSKPEVVADEVTQAREAKPQSVDADLGRTLDELVTLARQAKTGLILSQGAGGQETPQETTHEQVTDTTADAPKRRVRQQRP